MEKVQVVITRPMCVLGDNKATVRFEPPTKSKPFVEVSYQVYDRLKRAGAVKLYQQWLAQNVNEKPKPNEQEVSVDVNTQEVPQVVEQITQTSIESDKQSQKELNEQENPVDVDIQEVTQIVKEVEQTVDEKLGLNEQEVPVDVDTQDVEQTSVESSEQSAKAKTSKSSTRTTTKKA
ncbi:hypothetical protein [Bartonella sp. WD12.1]|uniref:hypothetical protein n=1 Tax=Bartonella sp. WD12.1 TaxID=1933903 RepID=UPI00099A1187|nr:hypothetical protein [Bartonella sp. WD12.1]OPB29822.1 hypothetical protein BWD121_008530 [Bartonella sp. WD12.1]OPB30032.1 hypothetical protein BWD121_010760 [Bartonella sp. WD12.1]